MLQDLRYAVRMLLRNPGFAAVAVLALALGIGPNSAIFSIVSSVLLRPLPMQDPDRAVSIWESSAKLGMPQIPASEANYLDWKRQSQSFELMGTAFALPEYGFNVMPGREPERVPGGKASATFFDALGVKPLLGRSFLEEEDRPGGPGVAIVSYGFWQTRLRADRAAIGRPMTVDGERRTVVGVLPANFDAFGRIDVWIPVAMNPNSNERANHTWGVFAQLKPGVTVQQAQAEMDGIARRLARAYPETNEGWSIRVIPVHQLVTGLIAPALMLLLGAVGLLLLLACANVANLLLARAAGRAKEIAVRTALGARRPRIVRQMLTESVLLSLAGGALGLLLARWCVGVLRGFVPDMLPLMQRMSIDSRVLLFTFGLSLLTGLVFGVVPAFKTSHTDLNETLKATGRALTGGGVQRIRGALVVAEVALALVLTVGAGLLSRSFMRLMSVNPGLRTQNLLTMQLTLPTARYPQQEKRVQFYKDLIQRVEALPGVQSAGAISFLPFRASFLNSRISVWGFRVEGRPPERPGQEPTADFRVVTPDFFKTMAIPLRSGRYFGERDSSTAPAVAIINETMARRYFPGGDAVGRKLRLPPWDRPPIEVVGVLPDVKLYSLDWAVDPAIYLPNTQMPTGVMSMSLAVHSTQNPAALAAAIRRQVLALDPEQPVADVRTMEQVVSDSTMLRRLSMGMIGAFAVLALVLATVGIYGLTAYSVSQRTHEIGLRMALGASGGDILRQVVGRGLVLSLVGLAFGMAGAYGVTRVLRSFLFGITSTDPVVLVGVPACLLLVAALASYIPARRAARVDPMVALRYE